MLNIVIFGPPGAGKGTQAEKLIDKYNLIHLSTGDMLRAERAAGTELGKKVEEIMNAGLLVSDDIVIEIIAGQLSANPEAKGFIFDGFPRTIPQAKALDLMLNERNTPISCCLSLDVAQNELVERLLKRAQDQGRADDTEEVIQERIREYENKTLPVQTHYEDQGKAQKVNGLGSVDDIFSRLTGVLDIYSTETV